MSSHESDHQIDRAIRAQILGGAAIALTLIGGFGGWAAATSLEGAVIAPATVVVESHKKRVQHDSGGIIAAINVRNGDAVARGDVLLRLDGTQIATEIAALEKRLFNYEARRRRLLAENAEKATIELPPELHEKIEADSASKEIVEVQQSLLSSRLSVRDGERRQLHERVSQLQSQLKGLQTLRDSISTELELFEDEIQSVDGLKSKQLVSAPRYNTLRRADAEKRGAFGQTIADIARTESQISETNLQILKHEMDLRGDILKELETIESEAGPLKEQLRAAQDRQARLNIVASDNGIIHELAIHTLGGVVRPGETLAMIVPSEGRHVLDAKVQAIDRDQIYLGMTARVRFSAFNQRTTPELVGHVETIGSDQATDDKSASPYYVVRVALDDTELSRLGTLVVTPGMPAEIMMTSAPRTVLSYLLKPVSDQFERAFREE
jgi:HlyD family secretion protein